MNPGIFPILQADPTVMAVLGEGDILRFFPFANAPEGETRPYATYGVYNGNPENYIDSVPDIDNMGTQIDIWAKESADCEAAFYALRDALETVGHMTNFSSIQRDPATELYTAHMEFDFWVSR